MSASYVIDQAKWAKLDIFNRMGNIYSEVGRSFKSTNALDRDMAVARAIDLFDATTLALSSKKSPKLRKVLRAKEEFLNIISDRSSTPVAKQSLENYFLKFAIAARSR